jgi:hypothetical protein
MTKEKSKQRKHGPEKKLEERVNVWLPTALMDHVRQLAADEDRSLAAMVRRLLQLAIEGRQVPQLLNPPPAPPEKQDAKSKR